MFHPFLAYRMNQQFEEVEADQLSCDVVDYANNAVRGLHLALREQTTPVFRRPEHPVDGWGLTATPLENHGEFNGIPVVEILGERAIYLSTKPNVMLRVLTVPHPRRPFEKRVIQARGTSVPNILQEDPTLYYGLLNSVEESIQVFGLDYQLPEPPIPSNVLSGSPF